MGEGERGPAALQLSVNVRVQSGPSYMDNVSFSINPVGISAWPWMYSYQQNEIQSANTWGTGADHVSTPMGFLGFY